MKLSLPSHQWMDKSRLDRLNPGDAMKVVLHSRRSLRWILLGLEWLLLLATAWTTIFSGRFQLVNPWQTSLTLVVFLSSLTLLSLIFPSERPLWHKRVYIVLEVAVIAWGMAMTGCDLTLLFYFVLLKSCLLLPRNEVVITAIAGVAALALSIAWSLPQILQRVRRILVLVQQPQGFNAYYDLGTLVLNNLVILVAVSTFVVVFGFVLVAEQQSRQKAEMLTQQVETLAATLERTRIAREIHDSLGHTLTTLDVQLELAQRLHQREPAQVGQYLDTAKHLSGQCLNDVRRALQTIRQPNFDLNQSLSTLIEQVRQQYGWQVQLDIQLPQLPAQVSHQLYCIIQEGLTNIQRHAKAHRVSLTGQQTTSGIILELMDDGQGFDPQTPRSGFGLRGMKERVQILGGQLYIQSFPEQGTQIRVVIPQ